MKSHHKKHLKILAIAVISLATLKAGGFEVMAQPWAGARNFCQETDQGRIEDSRERQLLRFADILELTTAQQQQIKQLIDAQNSKMQGHQQKSCEIQKALQNMRHEESFDESAVRKLYEQDAQLKADEMIELQQIKVQISKIFTPEQKILADKLQKLHGPAPREAHELHNPGPRDQHESHNSRTCDQRGMDFF